VRFQLFVLNTTEYQLLMVLEIQYDLTILFVLMLLRRIQRQTNPHIILWSLQSFHPTFQPASEIGLKTLELVYSYQKQLKWWQVCARPSHFEVLFQQLFWPTFQLQTVARAALIPRAHKRLHLGC